MAIDGSFSIQSALERFLARCPKLQSVRQFDSLVKKVATFSFSEKETVKKNDFFVYFLIYIHIHTYEWFQNDLFIYFFFFWVWRLHRGTW